VYAHQFDNANHADGTQRALSARFRADLPGNLMETTGRNRTKPNGRNMAQVKASSGQLNTRSNLLARIGNKS
jgi:hypothetical protein